MAEIKTKKTRASVSKFIKTVDSEQKQKDSTKLVEIFEKITGEKATMWGTSIIGFGEYHYTSERSSQEGNWPLTGFSPRKQQISIYIMPGVNKYADLLKELGKHKASKGSCLYIKKLEDVNLTVLKKIIRQSVRDMKKMYNVK